MLEQSGSSLLRERSARKEPLTDSEMLEILAEVDRVVVARGRSRRELASGEVDLADLKGPTGNYRAPMVVAGATLVVGLDLESVATLLTS